MAKLSWKTKAKKLLGKNAIHLSGDGQFAFFTPCRDPAFSLWATREEADRAMGDTPICGGGCHGATSHSVIDLGQSK